MGLFGKWGTFILVPEVVLGGVAYVVMASSNSEAAFPFALYVAGILAVLFIVYALIRDDEIGVVIANASLALVLAAFCAIAGVFAFAASLALIGGSLIFVADRLAGKK